MRSRVSLLGDQYDIDHLHNQLRDVNLWSGLRQLARMSADYWQTGDPYRRVGTEMFSVWQFGFLAQELIRVGHSFGTRSLEDAVVLERVMHVANGLWDYFQLNDEGDAKLRSDQRLSFMIRTAQEQFGFQNSSWYELARHRSIYASLADRLREAGGETLLREFRERRGISVDEFMQIGFCVLTLATQVSPVFDPFLMAGQNISQLSNVLTQETIRCFLSATTLTVEQFRERLDRDGSTLKGLERHRLGPLARFPILQTPHGFLAPSSQLLMRRISAGIYFDFLEWREGDRKAIQAFTSLFGRAFERHIGLELGWWFNDAELLPEYAYRGRSRSGPDWTVVEGNKATIFECKTSRLTRIEREAPRVDEVRLRLCQDIVPALKRLPAKIADIRDRVAELSAWPRIDDFECVVVTLEPWWPEQIIKSVIGRELQGTPAECLRYHLMWSEELERLGAFRRKTTIFELMRRKWSAVPITDTRRYLFNEARRLGLENLSARGDRIANEFFSAIVAGLDS